MVRPASIATEGVDRGNHGPDGHGEVDNTEGQAYGVVTTQLPPPVKGMSLSDSRSLVVNSTVPMSESDPPTSQTFSPPSWSLPELDFLVFDGENPQFSKYFDVYGVQSELWVRVATLHFTGNMVHSGCKYMNLGVHTCLGGIVHSLMRQVWSQVVPIAPASVSNSSSDRNN